jgi:hypothetical protein
MQGRGAVGVPSWALLPGHWLAALWAVYLKAGNAALVGRFGTAGWADAKRRGACRRPRTTPSSDTPAALSSSLPPACSFTALSSWHGPFSSLALLTGRAIIFPKSLAIPSGAIAPRQPEFRPVQVIVPVSPQNFFNAAGYAADDAKAQPLGLVVQIGA